MGGELDQKERLSQYPLTARQRGFEWDFTKGCESYEVWDEIEIGRSAVAQNTFEVQVEDILDFNRSCLETDPVFLDETNPRPHPLFVVMVTFYCIGTGIGSWIRTPGARNPGQTIEFVEDFVPGEVITATITHNDKWIRRGSYYMEDLVELRNQDDVLKARWYVRLLLPPTRADVIRFAEL